MIYGEDLYNSYFDEDDIDYVSERSFSDGFDYACRLFAEAAAEKEAKESLWKRMKAKAGKGWDYTKDKTAQLKKWAKENPKTAIAAALGTTAATAAGAYGVHKYRHRNDD